jgi:predicted restriction endonuclease
MSKAVAAAVLARDGHRCQAHAYGFDLVTVCAGRVHLHHRRLRSQGGTDSVSNLVCICELHHTRAHSQIRAEAEVAGIIVRSSVLDT